MPQQALHVQAVVTHVAPAVAAEALIADALVSRSGHLDALVLRRLQERGRAMASHELHRDEAQRSAQPTGFALDRFDQAAFSKTGNHRFGPAHQGHEGQAYPIHHLE